MGEPSDYVESKYWKGHDFADARSAYDAHAGRSYAAATSKGVTAKDLVAKSVTSKASIPLVLVVDVTGSMGAWPAVMFSKLPYLANEAKEYLGADLDVTLVAVGDAVKGDKYPLQVFGPASNEVDLPAMFKSVVVEGGGGGNQVESYDLAALYLERNFSAPNATRKPIVVMVGDEGHETVTAPGYAKYAGVSLPGSVRVRDTFEALKAKVAFYLVRKEYDHGQEAQIHQQWCSTLGDDYVVKLDQPERIVDVIFGILARETDRIDYFKGELAGRQRPEQVAVVMKSLATIHKLPKVAAPPPMTEMPAGPTRPADARPLLTTKGSDSDASKSRTFGRPGGASKPSKNLLGK